MLVEIPKWMFNAAHCATLRLAELPYVDCATLRSFNNSMAEQRVSVKALMLQPQLSRQAGHGDTNDSDFKNKLDATAGDVRGTTRHTTVERCSPTHARRGSKTSGGTARQCSDEQSSSHPSKPGRAR
jgi:hypothetical protein